MLYIKKYTDNKERKKVKVKSLSRVRLFATPWTVAYQAPQSMEFSRQEYWSGLPFPSPEDLPNPGSEPGSPALQADALPSEPPGGLKNGLIRLHKDYFDEDSSNPYQNIPQNLWQCKSGI